MNKGHCFQCEAKNQPEQMFCGQCGSSLVLKDYISAQITKGVSEATRDRKELLIADSVDVFERAWKWAKLAAGILAIPIVSVIALLGWLGWREFDLSRAAKHAQQQIENTARDSRNDITRKAEASIAAVQAKSGEAINANQHSIEAAEKASQNVTSIAAKTQTELKSEAASVKEDVAQSKKELEAVHNLQPEFTSMRSQLTQATDQLAAQQKVISSSEDFIKHVFGNHTNFIFRFSNFVQPNLAVVIPASGTQKNTLVLMLLPNAPVAGTLQLQYRIYAQPVDSFFQVHNLVVFSWGDAAASLKDNPLYVSCFLDKGDKKLYKKLDFRDGRAYLDDHPLAKFGQPDPGYAGRDGVFNFPEPED